MKKTGILIGIILLLIGLTSCLYKNYTDPDEQTYYPQYEVNDAVCMKDTRGNILMTAAYMDTVQVLESDGQAYVLINFTEEGKTVFAAITSEHIGESVEICVGDIRISAPTVVAPITEGYVTISTDSLQKAEDIVNQMKK